MRCAFISALYFRYFNVLHTFHVWESFGQITSRGSTEEIWAWGEALYFAKYFILSSLANYILFRKNFLWSLKSCAIDHQFYLFVYYAKLPYECYFFLAVRQKSEIILFSSDTDRCSPKNFHVVCQQKRSSLLYRQKC